MAIPTPKQLERDLDTGDAERVDAYCVEIVAWLRGSWEGGRSMIYVPIPDYESQSQRILDRVAERFAKRGWEVQHHYEEREEKGYWSVTMKTKTKTKRAEGYRDI